MASFECRNKRTLNLPESLHFSDSNLAFKIATQFQLFRSHFMSFPTWGGCDEDDDVGRLFPGKVGKSNRVAGPKSGISLRNEPPPPEICGAAYRAKSGGSYFQRLKQSEKGSRGDGAADACLHMHVEKC